ncbi:uncharacterized protein LOC115383145, partial [Tachysurus ichikawai]
MALHRQAPDYIKAMLCPYKTSRSLRADEQMLLTVLRARLRRSGDRSFSMAAP